MYPVPVQSVVLFIVNKGMQVQLGLGMHAASLT